MIYAAVKTYKVDVIIALQSVHRIDAMTVNTSLYKGLKSKGAIMYWQLMTNFILLSYVIYRCVHANPNVALLPCFSCLTTRNDSTYRIIYKLYKCSYIEI